MKQVRVKINQVARANVKEMFKKRVGEALAEGVKFKLNVREYIRATTKYSAHADTYPSGLVDAVVTGHGHNLYGRYVVFGNALTMPTKSKVRYQMYFELGISHLRRKALFCA